MHILGHYVTRIHPEKQDSALEQYYNWLILFYTCTIYCYLYLSVYIDYKQGENVHEIENGGWKQKGISFIASKRNKKQTTNSDHFYFLFFLILLCPQLHQ